MSDELLSISEASTKLKVSHRTLERMFASGEILRYKVDRRVWVRQSDIDAYLAPVKQRNAESLARIQAAMAALGLFPKEGTPLSELVYTGPIEWELIEALPEKKGGA
jgi:excisionase family DNA binding protein